MKRFCDDVTCRKCGVIFNPAESWADCDHGPIIEPQVIETNSGNRILNYCRACDTVLTRDGPCRHQIGYF